MHATRQMTDGYSGVKQVGIFIHLVELLIKEQYMRSLEMFLQIQRCIEWFIVRLLDVKLWPVCSIGTQLFFYSLLQLFEVEIRLDLTTVCPSTTLHKSYWPINLEKRKMYWEILYPHEMANIKIWKIIDLDKMRLFLESANRKLRKDGEKQTRRERQTVQSCSKNDFFSSNQR